MLDSVTSSVCMLYAVCYVVSCMLTQSLIRQNVYAATIKRLFGNGNGKGWE